MASQREIRQLWRKIMHRGVVHVGAHHMQEMRIYKAFGVTPILWVEANPEIAHWCQIRTQGYSNMSVYCGAISDVDYTFARLHVGTNQGASSSLLMPEKHIEYHPEIKIEKTIIVPTITIDTMFDNLGLDMSDYNVLVLDIEGVELKALAGAVRFLQHCDYIITEVSDDELYRGQPLYTDVDDYITSMDWRNVAATNEHDKQRDVLYAKEQR